MRTSPVWPFAAKIVGPEKDGAAQFTTATTIVASETTLSVGVSSICAEVTDAWLVHAPTALPVALNVIVTVWPGRMDAKLHSTWLLIAEHMPDGDVA